MKIASIVLHGSFTDGMAYQENCLPYYQKKVFNADVIIIAGQYCLRKGTKEKMLVPEGEYTCENGLRLIRIKSGSSKIAKKLAHFPTLYDVLELEKPDVIFAHLIQSVSLLSICKYKRKHKEILLYGDSHADTINSAHGKISINVLHKIIWKTILRYSSRYFERIYGVLPSRVDFLKDMYGIKKDKVSLLLMGAEDESIDFENRKTIRARIRNDLNINDDDFVLITGGKLDINKNIHTLLNALELLDNESIKLIIFGYPDNETKDLIFASKKMNNVRYIGWLESNEVYSYYFASDLCVFPGTHSVLWEQAVGCGMPCIFRYWKGINHVDRNGNIKYFYNKSSDELASIIKDISFDIRIYNKMKLRAQAVRSDFLYSNIALKSIEIGG